MTKYLNKTGIEWAEYTWNPATGCRHGCEYCYARKLATNPFYAKAFPHGFEPHFYPERVDAPLKHKKPSRIFCGSMTDMFGEWVPGDWLVPVFEVMSFVERHDFFVLTKNPRGIRKLYDETTSWYFGGGDYLDNVYLGVSVTCAEDVLRIAELKEQWVGPKFISFEPLLGYIQDVDLNDIDWIILGAQTNPYKEPNSDSIIDIIRDAEDADVPVFMKNNLGEMVFGPLWIAGIEKRQEYPERQVV